MNTNDTHIKPSAIKTGVTFAIVAAIAMVIIILILIFTHRRELHIAREEQYERDYRIAQQQRLIDDMQNEIILLNSSNEMTVREMTTEIYDLQETIDELVSGLPTGITTETMQATIRQVAELTTLVHEYTDVTIQDESNFWTNRLLIVRYSGRIRAGIDFERVDIAVDDYRIYVRVPPAQIFSHELPFDTIEVVRDETGIFTPSNTIPDFVQLMADLQRDKQVELINSGLLIDARYNAQETIRQLIYAMIIAQRNNPADFALVFRN